MPTISRIGPDRLFFYSADGSEPADVHVERDEHVAKFWLSPVSLVDSRGFRGQELRDIQRIVQDNQAELLGAWYDYFGD